ncbi:hypothetical protein OAO55_02965 [Bacteroidales bacterium]|nr:hypothetical protein [Bacteroidales bacterium]
MEAKKLTEALYGFLKEKYPNIKIEVKGKEPEQEIFFLEDSFKHLFPLQRYYFINGAIPDDFFDKHLSEAIWYELAPGEKPQDLEYHDEDVVAELHDEIIEMLSEKSEYKTVLKEKLEASGVPSTDFRISKEIFNEFSLHPKEQFDIFHVFMHEGAYCDSEILPNVFGETE